LDLNPNTASRPAVQNQRTAGLDLVFQKPLKIGGFHKRTGNKLVLLMVNYLVFF
jgi:hypothetical protein